MPASRSHVLVVVSLGRGFKLDFVQAEDDIAFVEWGEFRYDSLIFLAPRVEGTALDSRTPATQCSD